MKLLVGDPGWGTVVQPSDLIDFDESNSAELDQSQSEFTLNRDGLKVELYNLTDDPYEIIDLAKVILP